MSRTDIKKHFGEQVKARRKGLGYNQTQFGQLLGLTRTSVMNIESGRHSPTLEGFYKISCLLKCDPNDLLPKPKLLTENHYETVIVKKIKKKNFKPVKL